MDLILPKDKYCGNLARWLVSDDLERLPTVLVGEGNGKSFAEKDGDLGENDGLGIEDGTVEPLCASYC